MRTFLLTKSIIRRKNFIIALILVLLILLVSLAFSSNDPTAEKKELTFINSAVKRAKTTNKLLIMEFWAPDCILSTRLKEEVFDNKENMAFLDKNFLLIKVSPSDSVYSLLWKHFRLNNPNSCIFMDINGNEIDRSVNYYSKDTYLSYLKEVSEGRNLYCQVFMAYKKDSLDIRNNYLLAKKLFFRYQLKDASKHFKKVLSLDPENKKGFNKECRLKIAESERLERLNAQ
jgi:thioredoxin-related protein